MNFSENDKTIIGKFGSVYGVRGWIRVISFTDPIDNICNYPHWQMQQHHQWQPIEIEATKWHGKDLIVKIKNIDDREIARTYTNNTIAINKNELPKLSQDEYYWSDLIGLNVITKDGIALGKIDHLLETGSNDVLVIKGEREHMVPYTDDFIITINLDKKEMIVDWDPQF